MDYFSDLPNVRDGLTRKERIILHCIDKIQRERGDRNVPTAMLYGRVVEYVDMSVDEMQSILQKLVGDKQREEKI
jgi:predicted HTH domain antitoxin